METEKTTAISIVLNHDDDSLVGAEGWGEYDAYESLLELKRQIADRVGKAFPGIPVEVDDELLIDTRIYAENEDDVEYIRNLISDVWGSWDWLVE